MIVAPEATSRGYYYHMYEGVKRKNTTSRGPATDSKIPPQGTASEIVEERPGFAGA